MTFAQVRAQAVADAISFTSAHIDRLRTARPDELQLCKPSIQELHDRLGDILGELA
jgi:hypothetical protein